MLHVYASFNMIVESQAYIFHLTRLHWRAEQIIAAQSSDQKLPYF